MLAWPGGDSTAYALYWDILGSDSSINHEDSVLFLLQSIGHPI